MTTLLKPRARDFRMNQESHQVRLAEKGDFEKCID